MFRWPLQFTLASLLVLASVSLNVGFASASAPTPTPKPPFGSTPHTYYGHGVTGYVGQKPTDGVQPDHPTGSVDGASTYGIASLYTAGLYIEARADTGETTGLSDNYQLCGQVSEFNAGLTTSLQCNTVSGTGVYRVTTYNNWLACPPEPTTVGTYHYVYKVGDQGPNSTWTGNDSISQQTCGS